MNRAQAMERIKARRSRAEYQANHRRSQLMEGDAVCRHLMEERAQAGQNALERIQSGEGAEWVPGSKGLPGVFFVVVFPLPKEKKKKQNL